MRGSCKLSERKNGSHTMKNLNDFGFLNTRLKTRKYWSNVFRILNKKRHPVLNSTSVMGEKKTLTDARLPKTYSCASFLWKLLEDMCHKRKREAKDEDDMGHAGQERWDL